MNNQLEQLKNILEIAKKIKENPKILDMSSEQLMNKCRLCINKDCDGECSQGETIKGECSGARIIPEQLNTEEWGEPGKILEGTGTLKWAEDWQEEFEDLFVDKLTVLGNPEICEYRFKEMPLATPLQVIDFISKAVSKERQKTLQSTYENIYGRLGVSIGSYTGDVVGAVLEQGAEIEQARIIDIIEKAYEKWVLENVNQQNMIPPFQDIINQIKVVSEDNSTNV